MKNMLALWVAIVLAPAALLVALVLAPAAWAQSPENSWDELVAAAKKEGKVVVSGPPSQELRQAMPAAFKERFGVTLEYLGGRGNDVATRLRAERRAGLYTVDAILAGSQTMATILYREGMLDPLRSGLVLPEVTDGAHWKKGSLWFSDPDAQFVLRLCNTLTSTLAINTHAVRPDDLHSMQDLLDPRWKGKIAFQDPTLPGSGSNQAAQLYIQFGEEFFKRLYIDQKPVITRDTRQLTDWLVRGSYPVAFGAVDGEVEKLRKDGFPVLPLYSLSDWPGTTTAGFGQVAQLSHEPHPNAAKLFVNWIASKEGSEILARALNVVPARNDIDEASFLPPELIPRPGVAYFDTFDWQFTVTKKEEVRLRMKELMQAR
jgi:iron(III) transport system substrate-binding protein